MMMKYKKLALKDARLSHDILMYFFLCNKTTLGKYCRNGSGSYFVAEIRILEAYMIRGKTILE